MHQYQTFVFDSFSCSPPDGKILLKYLLTDPGAETIEFVETLTFEPIVRWDESRNRELHAACAVLHLIGGISYFKTCLPESIEIRTTPLTQKQADFWTTVYENGLGEFFFRNTIDFRGKIRFPADAMTPPNPLPPLGTSSPRPHALVPIGGGKDSVVTIELLKKGGVQPTLLRIGGHPVISAQAKQAGVPLLEVKRALSPRLFELNEQGALNGHVPITAYLNFLALVLAILRGDQLVVFSNERSANEGNVEYLGTEINHQWSKSLQFEMLLQDLVWKTIGPVEIFSLLRPLSELKITELLTTIPQYLPLVTSCNENWKIVAKSKKVSAGNLWCCECPKCAFVFTQLAAFLPIEKVTTLFGKNLYAEEALLPLFRELLGLEGFKPFECVGTTDETKAALLLAHKRGDCEDTAVMKMFIKDVLPGIKDSQALIDSVMTASNDHAIPERFLPLVPRD